MQVDSDISNDDNIHYFFTPIKHNHINPEIPETTTTPTPVQDTINPCLFQMGYSESTTSLKLPPSGK